MNAPPRKTRFALLAASLLLACGGCMELGHNPPAELLEQNLVQEQSTKQDVLDALGTPRGYGIISLPEFEGPPRTIWYYEHMKAGGGRISMNLLLVFFDREKYDGYLWYASEEKLVEGK